MASWLLGAQNQYIPQIVIHALQALAAGGYVCFAERESGQGIETAYSFMSVLQEAGLLTDLRSDTAGNVRSVSATVATIVTPALACSLQAAAPLAMTVKHRHSITGQASTVQIVSYSTNRSQRFGRRPGGYLITTDTFLYVGSSMDPEVRKLESMQFQGNRLYADNPSMPADLRWEEAELFSICCVSDENLQKLAEADILTIEFVEGFNRYMKLSSSSHPEIRAGTSLSNQGA